MGVPIKIAFEKLPLRVRAEYKYKDHFMIYKGFHSYLRRGYRIDTRMVDTGHALERRGLFYWRGSSIRDFTVLVYHDHIVPYHIPL